MVIAGNEGTYNAVQFSDRRGARRAKGEQIKIGNHKKGPPPSPAPRRAEVKGKDRPRIARIILGSDCLDGTRVRSITAAAPRRPPRAAGALAWLARLARYCEDLVGLERAALLNSIDHQYAPAASE